MAATVVLDGVNRLVSAGRPLLEVLADLGQDPARLQLRLNGTMLRPLIYGSTVLQENDVLECLAPAPEPAKAADTATAEPHVGRSEIFPVTSDTSHEEVGRMIHEWADKAGYRLTPDGKRLTSIVKGLIKHGGKYGAPLCPCMTKEITGDPKRDDPIACPCVFVHNDIKVDGACKCKFFVSKEYHDNMSKTLEEMNRL